MVALKAQPVWLSDVMTKDYLSPEFLSKLEQVSAPQITKRVAKTTSSKVNVSDLFFDNQYVDRKRLAEILCVGPSTISKMMAQDGLPHYKFGKSCRFKVSKVMEFLEKRRRP
jgi:excisionase family DNA binding protein